MQRVIRNGDNESSWPPLTHQQLNAVSEVIHGDNRSGWAPLAHQTEFPCCCSVNQRMRLDFGALEYLLLSVGYRVIRNGWRQRISVIPPKQKSPHHVVVLAGFNNFLSLSLSLPLSRSLGNESENQLRATDIHEENENKH